MHETMDSELLARYLAGEASAEERSRVEAWMATDPANQAEVDRLRRFWAASPRGAWDVDVAWSKVSARLDRQPDLGPSVRLSPRPSVLPVWRNTPLALAAALVLALGALLVWRARAPGAGEVPVVVVTAAGERRALELPDGTRITLAPASELRVDPGYGRLARRVDLAGEAWFEVRHDPSRPFLVQAAGTIVEDLGTEFAVRAVPDGSAVRVVVVSGSASLRRAGAPAQAGVVLHARDVGVLAAGDAAPVVTRNAAVEALVAWREGRLVFDDSPLDSVTAELSRWYGVSFRLAHPALASRRLSAPLPLDQLDDALEVLRLALRVTTERRGDTVIVR